MIWKLFQAVIEAGIIAPLVNLLQTAEFDIKKEAAWAISNATSGGNHDQVKYVSATLIFIWFTMIVQIAYNLLYVLLEGSLLVKVASSHCAISSFAPIQE